MKYISMFLAVLLYVDTANAIVITCVNEGSNIVRIDYDASDEITIPLAFALEIKADGGAVIKDVFDYKVGDSNKNDAGFGIFPASMKLDENGKIIDWGTPVISGLGTPQVTVEMASRYLGSENAPPVSGTLCRILVDTRGAPIVNISVSAGADGGGIILENTTAAKFNSVSTILGIRINRCKVTAGALPGYDSISVSGFIDAGIEEFLTPGTIAVTVNSEFIVNPYNQTFPIDSNTFHNNQYEYSRTENSSKTFLTFNPMTSKFSFGAKYVDLKGLSCPLNIKITIGDYTSAIDVNETIVNGPRRPIPIKLMMGVRDSLRIDRARVIRSTRPKNDHLTIKGGFSVQDTNVNMANEDFFATIGSQTFIIPANSFRATNNGYACSRVNMLEDSVAAARFNFKTGAFILKITRTKIAAGSGNVDVGFKFASFNQIKHINIP